jgi:DNA-binding NarL/FixJ family response regulator
MIHLVIADDHDIVRAGLCRILASEADFTIDADTGSGHQAVALCREHAPHVLLLDLDMPDMDGIEVTRQLQEARSKTRVLMLTMHGHEEYAVRVLEAGGAGFAVKGISQKDLPDAIRKVAAGGVYISPSIMEKTFMRQHMAGDNPVALLSEREMQVFIRLAKGIALNDIADELCLSDSSVRTYKRRVMDKLGMDNTADLIRYAIRHDLVSKF